MSSSSAKSTTVKKAGGGRGAGDEEDLPPPIPTASSTTRVTSTAAAAAAAAFASLSSSFSDLKLNSNGLEDEKIIKEDDGKVKNETPFKCNGLDCKKIVIRTESSSVSFCPKCIELKLSSETAVYCSRDCFGSAWRDHCWLYHKQFMPKKEKRN